MKPTEKKLLKLFSELNDGDRDTLLAFAEFLRSRSPREAKPAKEVPPPEPIPRPENETVVGALKRLSASYSMLDKSKMLHETSGLMAQHLMQGRAAVEVIDELEIVFQRYYERLVDGDNGSP